MASEAKEESIVCRKLENVILFIGLLEGSWDTHSHIELTVATGMYGYYLGVKYLCSF